MAKKKQNGKNGKNGKKKEKEKEELEIQNDFYSCTKCDKYIIVYVLVDDPKKLRCSGCGGMLKEVPPLEKCLEKYRERYWFGKE